jgi:outer membrane protein assembly factor BamB
VRTPSVAAAALAAAAALVPVLGVSGSAAPPATASALVQAVAAAESPPPLPQTPPSWPSFRGPGASGIADGADLPLDWAVEKAINVLWKAPIAGVGHSSPVIWGDRVFITAAVSSAPAPPFVHGQTDTSASANDDSLHSWRVVCLDLATGAVRWERTLAERPPRADRHVKASFANPTPATDGEHLVVSFGSEGLFALDLDGNLLWQRDLGILDGGWSPAPDTHWGYGSSPIIHEGLAIVQADAQNQSYVAAFDVASGEQAWRTERGEDTSWSTPAIVAGPAGPELVVSGTHHYRAYDPRTGEELWRLADGADVKIPTPIVAAGMLLLGGGSAHMRPPFYALRPGARGAIDAAGAGDDAERVAGAGARGEARASAAGTMVIPPTASTASALAGEVPAGASGSTGAIVWRNDARPHVVTPIAYRGLLYVCTDNGILTIYDLATGARINRFRLGGRGASFSASPVAADGRLYFASEDGDVFVLAAGTEGALLATNPVGEVIFATPAIVPGVMVIRGREHVFAIGAAERSSRGEGARRRPSPGRSRNP